MKPSLLAVPAAALVFAAAGLPASFAAHAQTAGGALQSQSQPPRYLPPNQTGAMLPKPAATRAASGAAAPLGASLPRAYRAPGRPGLAPDAADTRGSRAKLARYRAKPAAAASDDAANPYRYDGWSASSAYGGSAPAR